jgi:thiol-disulfide isomerase/thioredoxin
MVARFLMAFFMFTAVAFAQRPDDEFVGQKAPTLKPQEVWINSAPLKLESLRGKVVLIEFWAFDCEFCAEATPHMKEWHAKYAKDGLAIIAVHVPRIDYEKEIPKLKESVTAKGIEYPVVVDNEYQIWTDYLCDVWPSSFVVDKEGVIQLSHSGTGRYDEIESMIKKLLVEKK